MGATVGRETDALEFFHALARTPFRYDFYQTLRRIECLYADQPRWGLAERPLAEPVRLGQEPDLSFASAALASFDPGGQGRKPRLQVRFFGLLGPNGPLPLHLTAYARERSRLGADPTFSRFLDIFHHRFLALFYRAWAQAQPHVQLDRPGEDTFARYVGSFFGVSSEPFRARDRVPDLAKFFHAGLLARQVRNAEGLTAILQHFFQVPVRVQEFVGQWLVLGPRERTYLGREGATLGTGAVVGGRVWDRQSKFRLELGPLTLAQYESFLPGMPKPHRGEGEPATPASRRAEGERLTHLVDWVRLYLSLELDWDVRLVLKRREVPPLALGRGGRLGWTTWLGAPRPDADAGDLHLNAESFVTFSGVRAA
jgi:type VI secretion system protein ImpH